MRKQLEHRLNNLEQGKDEPVTITIIDRWDGDTPYIGGICHSSYGYAFIPREDGESEEDFFARVNVVRDPTSGVSRSQIEQEEENLPTQSHGSEGC